MLPLPRGSISRADSRPARKPAQQAISQTLRNTRSVVSRIGKLTLAPTLKMQTSSGACLSASLRKAATSSSFRASSVRADDRSARGLDLLDQRFELGAVAPAGEHGEAFGGEFLGDLAADIIAGADHGDGCVAFLHCDLRLSSSLRGAKRRSNPDSLRARSGLLASLAMTAIISPRPFPRLRATAPCRRTFPCRRRRSASRTRRARPRIGCSRSAWP